MRSRPYIRTALLFNATAEEMAMANEPLEDSVQLRDGGYLVSLGVYHELHCLVCNTSNHIV
jgi:hypothetical protein